MTIENIMQKWQALAENSFCQNGIIDQRYYHSLGVVEMALRLNEQFNFNVDRESIYQAGLFHDIAKNYQTDLAWDILSNNYDYNTLKEIHNYQAVWHGFVGAIIVNNQLGINSTDVINAIRYHTVGRPAMNYLEQLIFVSDYIEMGRRSEWVSIVREQAFKSLDKATKLIYEKTFKYLQDTNSQNGICNLSKVAYRYYQGKV